MFTPLEIAQEILDQDLKIKLIDGCLNVEGKIYSTTESELIIAELKEMHSISMRCQMLCDPVRSKLETLVLACEGC